MEIENQETIMNDHESRSTTPQKAKTKRPHHLLLLLLNVLLLVVGSAGSPLALRIYFLHGGSRKWFSALQQTAGFPFLLLPLLLHCGQQRRPILLLTPPLLLYCTVLGLLTGADNLLYSYGISYLPVSTSSLLISTQLGFTAVFAFFIVKQRLSAPTINAVALLTFGAVVLGVHANGDRPEGESKAKYYMGFAMTLAAALMYGLLLPLVELMYMKTKQTVTYMLVVEMQLVMGFFATVFTAVGMAANKDFQAISREAKKYGLGETNYYLVVLLTAVIAQCFFLGVVGTINYSSALLSGIIMAASIPLTEVLAVFFFHESFDAEKGIALALSLWGSASYFYGEYTEHQKSTEAGTVETQLPVSC